jgi:hypothetical protein
MPRLFPLIVAIVLLSTPVSSAAKNPVSSLSTWLTIGEFGIETINYVVNSDVRQLNEHDIFTQDEFNLPMYIEVGQDIFVIGTVPTYDFDSENNDGMWNRLAHTQTGFNLQSNSSVDVVVKGNACETEIVRALGGVDTGTSKKFLETMETSQWVLHHAKSLPLNTIERKGSDVLYGGYLTTQSNDGAWVGCTVGISEVSFTGSTIVIEPITAPSNIGDCVENYTGRAWTDKSSHPWLGVRSGITTACSDKLSATYVRGQDGDDFDAGPPEFIPRVGRLGACVATNGTHDIVLGGVSARGEFVEDWFIRNRETGAIQNQTENQTIRTVGGSCYLDGNMVVSVGGFSKCSPSEDLWVERDVMAWGKWKGPAFGGGCLAYLTEGFTIQKNKLEVATEKYPHLRSNADGTPIFSFPSLVDNEFLCSNTIYLNFSSGTTEEFTAELPTGCQVFSSDVILEDGILVSVGGMNEFGTVQTLLVHFSTNNTSNLGVDPHIIAVLKVPRVAPVILANSENITIYGGMNFALPSGPLYTTIEEFNSTTHTIYEVKYGYGDTSWMENDADGFTITIAFLSIILAVVAPKRTERKTF